VLTTLERGQHSPGGRRQRAGAGRPGHPPPRQTTRAVIDY